MFLWEVFNEKYQKMKIHANIFNIFWLYLMTLVVTHPSPVYPPVSLPVSCFRKCQRSYPVEDDGKVRVSSGQTWLEVTSSTTNHGGVPMATATLLVISIPFLTRTNHSTSSHGCSPSGAHHHSTLSRVSGRTPPFGGSCTSMTTLIFTTSVHLNNHLLNKDWNHPIRLHTKPGQGTTEKEKEREGGVRKKQNEKKRGWERETERNDRGGGG